jgi:hypothetical protein
VQTVRTENVLIITIVIIQRKKRRKNHEYRILNFVFCIQIYISVA